MMKTGDIVYRRMHTTVALKLILLINCKFSDIFMLTLKLIINLTKIIISKMGPLRARVMNLQLLQSCSLLFGHPCMHVHAPAAQLSTLSVFLWAMQTC